MDRCFIIDEKFIKTKGDLLGQEYKMILHEYTKSSMDKYIITNNLFCPSITENINGFVRNYKCIPVGDIAFIKNALEVTTGSNKMNPLEVPKELYSFLQREYKIIPGKEIKNDILTSDKYFIKDATELKTYNNLLNPYSAKYEIDINHNFVVTEMVNFLSEFRVFIYNDKIQSIQHYLGDPLIFPDSNIIKKCIKAYSKVKHPKSYTLDIGIRMYEENLITEPIEVHPFAACGLYGFHDECILNMLENGWDWYIQENKEVI